MTRNVLTAKAVAARLGVKLETVYAYVSRGVLTRSLSADGRTSRFDTAEVEALSHRGRPRRESVRTGTVQVTLTTSISGIIDDRLIFRGHDATALAASSTFEEIAELLWTGTLPEAPAWGASKDKLRVARAAAEALPRTAGLLDRLIAATVALAAAHPLRVDLRPETVTAHARTLLTGYVAALPRVSTQEPSAPRRHGYAARLFSRLSPLPATPARVALLDATLVLLADHELATSTFAARVAASTRADPFAVVLAGLGAVSGPLHGRAAAGAHRMILAAMASSPEEAVARALDPEGWVPGFGHPVYSGVDPRARHLLALVPESVTKAARVRLDAVLQAGEASASRHANVDFALGAVAFALQMAEGATEAVFAVSRVAGFVAHAMEEYGEPRLRFRPRSLYTG